jgi:hypothetical protein
VFIPRDVFFGLTRPLFSDFWLASFILLILDWRAGKPPRDSDPSFTRPDADVEEGEEEEGEEGDHSYQPVANTIPTYPRQSTYDNSNATAQSLPSLAASTSILLCHSPLIAMQCVGAI